MKKMLGRLPKQLISIMPMRLNLHLSGANLIPIGKHKPWQPKAPAHRRSAFERLEFSPQGTTQPGPRSVFDRQLSGQSQALRFNRPSDKIFHRATHICSRCLASGHLRVNCRAPIKCHACRNWGMLPRRVPLTFDSNRDTILATLRKKRL